MRSHRTGPVAARHCQRIRACGAPPPWPISSGFALDSPLEGDGFELLVPRSQDLEHRRQPQAGVSSGTVI